MEPQDPPDTPVRPCPRCQEMYPEESLQPCAICHTRFCPECYADHLTSEDHHLKTRIH